MRKPRTPKRLRRHLKVPEARAWRQRQLEHTIEWEKRMEAMLERDRVIRDWELFVDELRGQPYGGGGPC